MANYVQTRITPTGNFTKTLNHNLRITKPNYLRIDMYHNNFDNFYYCADIYKLKSDCKKHEKEFRELYRKRVGRNPQKGNASAFLEGVITLSNSINKMLEYKDLTPQELNSLFLESLDNVLQKIEDITGTKPKLLNCAIHYDEKTPHLHYFCTNYTKEGKSIAYAIKISKRLSELQDEVGKVFNQIGFRRGERKSKAKHLSVVNMHKAEIKELMKDIKKQKKELKKLHIDKITLKKELDKIDMQIGDIRQKIKEEHIEENDLDRLSQELKELNKKICSKISTSIVDDIDDSQSSNPYKKYYCKIPEEGTLNKYR